MAFTVSQLSSESIIKIKYTHNEDVNAWEPINVEGLGVLVPVTTTKQNLPCVYYRFGCFKFTVAEDETINVGDAVYYDSKLAYKTKKNIYLGRALTGGTGNDAGTVSVEVSINDNPPIEGGDGEENGEEDEENGGDDGGSGGDDGGSGGDDGGNGGDDGGSGGDDGGNGGDDGGSGGDDGGSGGDDGGSGEEGGGT
jgi:hypothetical protein